MTVVKFIAQSCVGGLAHAPARKERLELNAQSSFAKPTC